MLDTNPCLRIDPAPLAPQPISSGMEKHGVHMDYERRACHNLREVLQLKLQQRRTREELVNQGIMPPLKTPATFHEQRRSLERARTEDYLKRKIRSRPERSELVRMHILEETSAEPSVQAKQMQLKRARLADNLNDKISHRPGPMELIHKNILPVHGSLKQALMENRFPKAAAESSSFDEDSSDALSPDQPAGEDSPLGPVPPSCSPDVLNHRQEASPTQFLSLAPPPPPPPITSATPVPQNLTNGTATTKTPPSKQAHSKPSADRPAQRHKKPKESKPKVKKLKYHQYIPPDQKVEREPPPQLDSSYAKILHQQQLFLQLQIISQQQQHHYNYHTILPAPPKPPADQQTSSSSGPSPCLSGPAPLLTTANQNGQNRLSHQNHLPAVLPKPGPLPPNLDDFKVAELKHELKIRGLPVSGTKTDLIERLRNFQEQQKQLLQPSAETGVMVAAFPLVASVNPAAAGPSTAPPAVTRFSSTSSSPPASPTTSDPSVAGMSPDQANPNGDAFTDTVSSTLTQLSLHPSPQLAPRVKEEGCGPSLCGFSCPPSREEPLDKDQMLQEKDKQIEELTRMLQQKQRLVETLRSQLELGKRSGPKLRIKEEPSDAFCCSQAEVTVKVETEEEEQLWQEPQAETDLEPKPELGVWKQQDEPETPLPQATQALMSLGDRTDPPFFFSVDQPKQCKTSNHNKNGHVLIQLSSHRGMREKFPEQLRADNKSSPSTPTTCRSQSPLPLLSSDNQSVPQLQSHLLKGSRSQKLRKKMQHAGLLLSTNSNQEPSKPFSAPPDLQPFFLSDDSSPPAGHAPSSLTHLEKKSSHQIDDLFHMLIESGEIPCFRDAAEPLHLHTTAQPSPKRTGKGGESEARGRLEDFLESTTGKPLLGAEPGAPLTLIDDLHCQMLSTSSILDHPPSPMDTCEPAFAPQVPTLDFADVGLDSMDWLDLSMVSAPPPLGSQVPPSVFSTDFLDGADLQLSWDSCL